MCADARPEFSTIFASVGILACSEFLGVGPVLSLFAARTPAGTDRQDAFAFDQEPAVGFGLGLPPETFLRDKKMDDRTFFCRSPKHLRVFTTPSCVFATLAPRQAPCYKIRRTRCFGRRRFD